MGMQPDEMQAFGIILGNRADWLRCPKPYDCNPHKHREAAVP